MLEDIPVAGMLFRPMNNGESSFQQNIILAQTVIYPTLFDLMGLRWAPAVADLSVEDIKLQEFTYRSRIRYLKNEVLTSLVNFGSRLRQTGRDNKPVCCFPEDPRVLE